MAEPPPRLSMDSGGEQRWILAEIINALRDGRCKSEQDQPESSSSRKRGRPGQGSSSSEEEEEDVWKRRSTTRRRNLNGEDHLGSSSSSSGSPQHQTHGSEVDPREERPSPAPIRRRRRQVRFLLHDPFGFSTRYYDPSGFDDLDPAPPNLAHHLADLRNSPRNQRFPDKPALKQPALPSPRSDDGLAVVTVPPAMTSTTDDSSSNSSSSSRSSSPPPASINGGSRARATSPDQYLHHDDTGNNRSFFTDHRLRRPREMSKVIEASPEILRRQELLSSRAVVVVDNGRFRMRCRREVKDVIAEALGVHEFHVHYLSNSNPHGDYLIMCSNRRVREVLLEAVDIASRAGNTRLCFYPWLAEERCAEECSFDFYVRINLEGLPEHAWDREVVETIMSDCCIVHHVVTDDSNDSLDYYRAYRFWAWTKDPREIPSKCYLTIADPSYEGGRTDEVGVAYERPRSRKRGLVYCIDIHIEDIEDLS